MPKFQIQRHEQILAKMIARTIARSRLSDVSDSSGVKHVLSAAARADDEIYYAMSQLLQLFSIDTATGVDLDERAKEIQPAAIYRQTAIKATGHVVFSRTATIGSVTIPQGTKVKTAGGAIFSTTASGTITPGSPGVIPGHGPGRDSGLVPILADSAGAAGNVAAGTITKFGSKPPGVDEVTNLESTVAGADQETDDSFRARIKQYISSLARSTPAALEYAVLGAQDPDTGATIRFSKVWEDSENRGYVILYVDDGSGSIQTYVTVSGENVTYGLAGPPVNSAVGGETVLWLDNKPVKDDFAVTLTSSVRGALTQNTEYTLNPASSQLVFDPALVTGEVITASYTYYTGLIQLAQKIVDGDPADRATYPGYRAAGVLVQVRAPYTVIQTLACVLTIAEGYDAPTVRQQVREALVVYINNLGISSDVVLAKLIAVCMGVAGVINVVFGEPLTDIVILDNQIARTSEDDVLVE